MRHYDSKVRSSILQPGDRVLVRNLSPRGGPGKLRSFWVEEVHVVVSRKGPDSPVYEVRSESKAAKSRTLHRNMLLPCDHLSSKSAKPKSLQRRTRNPSPVRNDPVDDISNTSDDDHEFLPVLCPLPTRVKLTNNGCQETEDPLYKERPAEEVPKTRADQNVEGEGNVVGEGQEGDQAVEVEPNQAEPGDVEANNRPNDRVAGTEETVVPNVANCPQRNRQVPQWFSYYAPGHATCYRCGAIITQFHQFQQQPYQPIPPALSNPDTKPTPMAIQLSDVPESLVLVEYIILVLFRCYLKKNGLVQVRIRWCEDVNLLKINERISLV